MNCPLHELHQLLDVSQFQESLEEECRLRYCWGEMGCATSSSNSRWRRFLIMTAARKSDRSRSARLCPIYSIWDTTVLGLSWIPLWIDGTCDLSVPIRPSRCTSAQSSQFWVAIHDRLGVFENDREFPGNVLLERQLFFGISSTRWKRYGTLSVLQFCRAEHHGGRPFLIS